MKSAATIFTVLLLAVVSSEATEPSAEDEPVMLSASSNLRVREGDTLLLPCKVKNLGRRVRLWKQLPANILFSGTIAVSRDTQVSLVNESLQIEKVTTKYAGQYVCQVSKHPQLSVLHKIEVLVPTSVSPDPSEGKVIFRKGDSATILCNPSGIPKPDVTWTYGDEYTQGSGLPRGVRLVQGSELHFPSVDVHHAGIYTCTAENNVGPPAMATFILNVQYAPELLVKPRWVHGDVGSSAEFVCTCRSFPLSHVSWIQGSHRTGQKLEKEDGRVQIKIRQTSTTAVEYILRLQRLSREDLGPYTCVAKNVIGQSWKTVVISGLAEPVRLQGNESGENSFLLRWKAKSYSPIIEYQLKIRKHKKDEHWTDVMIPAITQNEGQGFLYSQTYNVTGLEPNMRYEAVLQAHNDFGWNRPSETFLFGEELPIPEPEPEEEEVEIAPSLLPLYEAELDVTDPTYSEQLSAAKRSRTISSSVVYIATILFAHLQFCIS